MVTRKKVIKTVIGVILIYGCTSLIINAFRSSGSTDLKYAALTPRNHLLFVKTHKTGSCTVINLFQRYAYVNNLTVALPRQDDIFLGWPRLLKNIPAVVLSLSDSSRKFNYIINHLVYEESLISSLYAAEPVRVTLVKEPSEQLRSSFNYYNILKEDGDTTTSVVKRMQLFFSDPSRFDSSYRMDNWFVKSKTRNPQLGDLGLRYKEMVSEASITQYVEMLTDRFDLIMVAEMMDESFLLLKRLMRWQLQDILYENKYALPYPGKQERLPDALKSSMFDWNWGDNLLYWKAKERLLKLMANEPRFHDELINFIEVNTKVTSYCTNSDLQKNLVIDGTIWNTQFTVNNTFCRDFRRKERPFTRLLQLKQRPDIYNQTYYESIEDSHSLVQLDNQRFI